jgi:hypothetical protein
LSKLRPRETFTRAGAIGKPWPASNLADGLLSRQDLGLALLDQVADRRTLNRYQMMAVRTRRASAACWLHGSRVPFFEAAIMDARHYQAGKMDMLSIYRASEQTEEEDEEEADWQNSVHFGWALTNDAALSDALGKLT